MTDSLVHHNLMNLSFLFKWHDKTLEYSYIHWHIMKQLIIDKVEESFKIAEKFYNQTFERPKQIIFKRSGTVGGHSNYGKRELMFQLDFAESVGDKYIETCIHEVAHYVQRAVYGYISKNGRKVMPHGREWKYIMRVVYGLSPERCHSYDLSVTKTRKQKTYQYACGCGKTFNITTTMHNKLQKSINESLARGISKPLYRRICKSCRQNIKFVDPSISILDERIKELQKMLAERQLSDTNL
jgi:SprT protein